MLKRAFVLYDHRRSRPLAAAIDNGQEVATYILFLRGTGKSLDAVERDVKLIQRELDKSSVMLNDFKAFLNTIGGISDTNVCDAGIYGQPRVESETQAIAVCKQLVSAMSVIKPAAWMQVLARAARAYHTLQNRGLFVGSEHINPQYWLDTISGRSRVTGFNIQGANERYDIRPWINEHEFFIHIDWIAADFRAAQLLSGDEKLAKAFETSDPYEAIATDGQSRNDCKKMLMQALYRIDAESLAIQHYPTLQKWMLKTADGIRHSKCSKSLLGRKFHLSSGDEHDLRRVFNASIQGTVAHALQNALWNLYNTIPDNIVTETHDSITLSADKGSLKHVIVAGIKAMYYPFSGIVSDNPRFPMRVFVGRRWRAWQLLKEVR